MQRKDIVCLSMGVFRTIKGCDNYDLYKDDNAVACYIALRILSINSNNEIITTMKDMVRALGIKNPNQRQIQAMKSGFEVLYNNLGYGCNYEKMGATKYLIDLTNIMINEEYYFKIPIHLVNRVASQGGFSLLHTYATLCSTINIKTKVGMTTQENMINYLSINRRALCNHYCTLKELGVIVFSNQLSYKVGNNIINKPKMYCLPEHRDILDEEYDRQVEKIKSKK